jgi:hypothetical protein
LREFVNLPGVDSTQVGCTALGSGFSPSRMRASMIAFVKVFDPTALRACKLVQDADLPQTFGYYLAKSGCTQQTSWLLNMSGGISADTAVLNAVGDPGGQKRKDPSKGLDSTSLQMAKSLGIPSNLRVCLRSDSLLTLYPTKRPEDEHLGLSRTSAMGGSRGLRNRHSYIWDAQVNDGYSLIQLHDTLPKDPAVISRQDVTCFITMLNRGDKWKKGKIYGEWSAIGAQCVALCRELHKHKRPFIIIGGDGPMWGRGY